MIKFQLLIQDIREYVLFLPRINQFIKIQNLKKKIFFHVSKTLLTRTVNFPVRLKIISFGLAHLDKLPFSLIPIIFGALSSHGIFAIASTASAPPTPIAIMPNPPAFGV